MAFYDLDKASRKNLAEKIYADLNADLLKNKSTSFKKYFSDEDTYIRRNAYLATGRLYFSEKNLQLQIIDLLKQLYGEANEKIRQTTINAAGEIGKKDFEAIESFMHEGLLDLHHCVRNAVIGSIKKMGEKNPKAVLVFARKYLHHPEKEIRREICHGIELRGRTHPQDILPLLKELQFDKTARVRNTLIHVIGQIAYKKGCLETVIADLKNWENKELVADAIEEIVDVHDRYKDFAVRSVAEAIAYIQENY